MGRARGVCGHCGQKKKWRAPGVCKDCYDRAAAWFHGQRSVLDNPQVLAASPRLLRQRLEHLVETGDQKGIKDLERLVPGPTEYGQRQVRWAVRAVLARARMREEQ